MTVIGTREKLTLKDEFPKYCPTAPERNVSNVGLQVDVSKSIDSPVETIPTTIGDLYEDSTADEQSAISRSKLRYIADPDSFIV